MRLGRGLFQEHERMKETLQKNTFLEKRIEELLKENESAKQELGESLKKIKKLESHIGVLEMEIEHSSQKVKESQKANKSLSDQLAESEKAYLDLTKEAEELRKKSNEQQMVLRMKQEEEIKLKDQLTLKDAKAFSSDSKSSNLMKILDEKEKEIESMQKTILHKNHYIEILMNEKHKAILASNGESLGTGGQLLAGDKRLELNLLQENMKLKETVQTLTNQNSQMKEELEKKQKELVTFIEDNRFLLDQIKQQPCNATAPKKPRPFTAGTAKNVTQASLKGAQVNPQAKTMPPKKK